MQRQILTCSQNTYKPECECYNFNSDFPPNVPLSPRCLMYTGCSQSVSSDGGCYLDPASRATCPEDLTICNQVVNVSGASAGGNINVSPELEMKCGGQSGFPGEGNQEVDTGGTTQGHHSDNNNTNNTNKQHTYNESSFADDIRNFSMSEEYAGLKGSIWVIIIVVSVLALCVVCLLFLYQIDEK